MSSEVRAGTLWRHHKGGVYRVVTSAVRLESTGEPLVVYCPLRSELGDAEIPYLAMPVGEWLESVGGVPRFVRLSDEEAEAALREGGGR